MNDIEVVRSLEDLDFIYVQCAEYMTDKSMKRWNSRNQTAKRQKRYAAFTKLIGEVTREIGAFGGRTLAGPADFLNQGSRNYWLERLDPKHRAGFEISGKYDEWVQSGSDESFWDWLIDNGGRKIKKRTRVEGYDNSDRAQWQHCCYFENGLLYSGTDDREFATNGLKTEFSGSGWAVFVVSLPMKSLAGVVDNYIFSYEHEAGYKHHSSFLGGAAVLAAGEWTVDVNGKISVITAKSGHYMPRWQNMHSMVLRLHNIPGDAIIRPNMLDWQTGGSIRFYTVSDFRSRNINATPLRRRAVMDAIRDTGANTNITEHIRVNGCPVTRTLKDMLPP
jgi:hypothetical protein